MNLSTASNLEAYTNAQTVDYYSRLTGLQPCEQYVFSKYVPPAIDILDLGVGGGRTTPYLSSDKRRYVGVDYSSAMIDICRKTFPGLPFHTLDAADLSHFDSGHFDTIVFSFNGIDYLYPDDQRWKCLLGVHRLLKPNGLFIFSVHNAKMLAVRPRLGSAAMPRKTWRLLRAVIKTVLLFSRQLGRQAFYNGAGYINDPIHGGLLTHTSTPGLVKEELANTGFRLLEIVSGNYPARSGIHTSPWFYFVAGKI